MLAEIQNKISADEILKALEVVDLKDDKDKKFSKYSLGMKQKLGVAQAIMEILKLCYSMNLLMELKEKPLQKSASTLI